MLKRYVLSLAAATIGSGLIAVSGAYAFGPGGHGHHGFGAAKACIAVMTSTQRANLKTLFKGEKGNFWKDRKALMTAQEDLQTAILTKSDVSSAKTAVEDAQKQVLEDKVTAATNICGVLNPTQLSAAVNLNNQLVALRKSTHETAHGYFKAARTAAGDPPTSDVQGPQNAE